MNLVYEGRCWKFGDMLACDGDMAPLDLVYSRETRPDVLRARIFEGLDPDFATKINEGDIIVAGKRFGIGHAHPQAAYAIAAARLGVVAESVPYLNFRNLVNSGVPFLPEAPDVGALCETGDTLRVDFETGSFANLTKGHEIRYAPLAKSIQETIRLGGWKPMFRARLDAMRTSVV